MSDLTNKQQAFVEEYLIDLNGTQAAIRAGYSQDTARQIASETLSKPNVQEAIQELMTKRSKRTEITADKVLQEIAKLGFSNMLDYISVSDDGLASVNLSQLDREQAAAITEITVETRKEFDKDTKTSNTIEKVRFKLADKGQNLERLGRHLKLFTDKHQVDGGLIIHIGSKDAELG